MEMFEAKEQIEITAKKYGAVTQNKIQDSEDLMFPNKEAMERFLKEINVMDLFEMLVER